MRALRFLRALIASSIAVLPAAAAAKPFAAASVTHAGSRTTPRTFALIAIGRSRWNAVSALAPVPRAGGLALAGPFERDGWSVGVVMQRRVRLQAASALYVGGEFAGFAYDSPWRDAGVELPSGNRVRARLYANASQFTLSTRMIWRTTHPTTVHATAGAGLYLLGIKDWVDGDGEVQTGNNAASPGGFAGLGLNLVWVGRFGLQLEARVHAFRFRHIGGDFPGESVGGPLYELSAGLSGWTR